MSCWASPRQRSPPSPVKMKYSFFVSDLLQAADGFRAPRSPCRVCWGGRCAMPRLLFSWFGRGVGTGSVAAGPVCSVWMNLSLVPAGGKGWLRSAGTVRACGAGARPSCRSVCSSGSASASAKSSRSSTIHHFIEPRGSNTVIAAVQSGTSPISRMRGGRHHCRSLSQ